VDGFDYWILGFVAAFILFAGNRGHAYVLLFFASFGTLLFSAYHGFQLRHWYAPLEFLILAVIKNYQEGGRTWRSFFE